MVGETVGNYKILAQIGEGGMGVVYLAEHCVIGKRAALKMLLPGYCRSKAIVTRFFNEARATAKIKHPGLIEIYDFGYHTDESAYIVMEYLDGESLAALIKRQGGLELGLAIELSRQMAIALGAAHATGIVHRDLKPDNIFLVPSEELRCGRRAKVLDFGIAKVIDHASASQMKTRTGVLMGTPAYMSPEQCRGASRVDHRADVYSLGCMMFEMVSGKPPFAAEGLGGMIAAHLYDAPPSLAVAPQLEPVVSRAMAKTVEERYQNMAEVLADLDAVLMRRPLAPRPKPRVDGNSATVIGDKTLPPEVVAAPPASRGGLMLGVLALALAAGGGAWWWRAKHSGEPAAGVAVAPSPSPTPPLSPPPARVALRLDSTPPGAAAYRVADGVFVGKTPLSLELERGQGLALFVLKLPGYRDASVSLPIDRDGDLTIVLPRAAAPSPKVTARTVDKPRAPEAAPPPPPAPKPPAPPPAEVKSHSIKNGELHSPF